LKFNDKFNEVLAGWLRTQRDYVVGYDGVSHPIPLKVGRVTGFDDYTYSSGYCETCYFEEQRARIHYETPDGDQLVFHYYGKFAELLEELLDVEVD